MSTSEPDPTESWVPSSCLLPTVERPLRLAEFDELFTRAVGGVERLEPGRVRLALEPTAEVSARAADLMVREIGCCSFFAFTLTATNDALHLEVSVPGGHIDVLNALAARAEAAST